MAKESPAERLLLDMVEAIQSKDRERLRKLLGQKVVVKNCIMTDEYLTNRYIALLTSAIEEFEADDRITELDEMIPEQQKEGIKRIALQKQVTFEQVVREAIDEYLRHNGGR